MEEEAGVTSVEEKMALAQRFMEARAKEQEDDITLLTLKRFAS
jgi:hypothetical protein